MHLHYKTSFLSVVCLFCGLSSFFGQSPLKHSNLEEIHRELNAAEDREEKIAAYSKLAFYYRRRAYIPDSSLYYIQKMEEECDGAQRETCLEEVFRYLGEYYTNQDQPEEGKYYLLRSLKLSKSKGNNAHNKDLLYHLGRNYYLNGIYDSSLYYYQKVLDHRESSANNLALTKIGMGKTLSASNLFSEAESYYNKAFEDHSDNLSEMDQFIILSEIMDFYTAIYPNPEKFAHILPQIAELEQQFFKQKSGYHLRQNFTDQLPSAQRIAFLLESIPHLKKNRYIQGLIFAYFDSARLLHEANRSNEALKMLDDFFGYLKDNLNVSPSLYSHVYNLKYEIEKDVGQFDKALTSLEAFKRLEDSIRDESNVGALQEMNVKYQSAQKDAEIAAQDLEISRKTSQRNFYLGGLVIIGLLSTFLLNRFQLRQKISEEKIANLEQQQKLLAMDYMVQGQENERKRIAKDLHDGLGGLLATARLQLQSIQKEIDKLSDMQLFQKAENLIENAHGEVRRIAHDMMPDALVNLGLEAAVEDLAQNLRTTVLNVTTYFPNEVNMFGEGEEVVVYRIIQEACQNVVKHAEATNLHIQMTAHDKVLSLVIEDDGKGFNKSDISTVGGMGLKNIESRVKYLGGQLTIDSSPETGTVINVDIPLG